MAYGIHHRDKIMVDDVLSSPRVGTPRGPQRKSSMNQVIKEQLWQQNSRLRGAFVHEDPRLTGNIATYMIGPTLKAGGLELSKEQLKEAKDRFITGEGRFNWAAFCDHVESARKQQWSTAGRLKTAKMFQDIDADGSGRIDTDELKVAVSKLNIKHDQDTLERLVKSCDADGDGNISYEEFVDGLARDLVAPTSVWNGVKSSQRPRRL